MSIINYLTIKSYTLYCDNLIFARKMSNPFEGITPEKIRNIAIIAHVDHGKTTLVDNILKQSGTFRENENVNERAMDSNDIEKERGITILAKCTAIKFDDYKINIVDTPGHADFGGEVERVLSMVDGVVLLVDAAEGPMPQTKFVLGKALKLGLRPIVIINKIDRQDERHNEVLDEIFDLFCMLNATPEQLDFTYLYASGRAGWAVKDLADERKDLMPLFHAILEKVPSPDVDTTAPFSMLATILHADNFLGRLLTGRVYSGKARVNTSVRSLNLHGEKVEDFRLTKLQGYFGTHRIPIDEAIAGDIVTIAGLEKTSVADTICDISVTKAIYSTPIDPPTISITIGVNTSPLAGQEGDKVTSRTIRDRLYAEAESNVAITVTDVTSETFEVGGRGELQLGVLIENMRREGFELTVARPKVLFQKDENGNMLEPIEEVLVDVDEAYSGSVVAKLNVRKGEMIDMRQGTDGKTRITYLVPSRGLIGYYGEFLTDTKGTGTMNRLFSKYAPYKGKIESKKNGVLVSNDTGEAVAYAIFNLQDRGTMFIRHGDKVYKGMIVGENAKENDLDVNVLKGKQLTNIRSSGADEAIRLVTPKLMTLEEMIAYIQNDELVEVTPKSLRLRKRYFELHERKKNENKDF